ncbi:uncharacterized protein LOC131887561 [Tigriopus californicus]|uniref:uncharacterized protein LOC131887561 n=1 Tax=Tigriopus californicus TaxID=6832 RepID=UPI0027DAB2B8|nr:uncharacterized protein LOC131887561 [Tigriopus californicus]
MNVSLIVRRGSSWSFHPSHEFWACLKFIATSGHGLRSLIQDQFSSPSKGLKASTDFLSSFHTNNGSTVIKCKHDTRLRPTDRQQRRGKFSPDEHSMRKLSSNLVRICGGARDRGEMASPVNETSLKWQ